MITTDGACFIPEWNNHALIVAIRQWQLMEHVSYLMGIWPCSDRCHEMITNDGVCSLPEAYHHALTIVIRWQLTEHVFYLARFNLPWPLSRWWQMTGHVSYPYDQNTCSVRCHGMMTTDRACFIPEAVSPCSDIVMRWWWLIEHVS